MRRGNKSHKVPNVKLRPAPPPTRSSRVRDSGVSCDHSSDSEMPPNASMVDFCPRPFRGFTICATGTMDKPTLFKMAFELGGNSTSDFTDRVTHLVASSHGGAKYLCALERKIPIMTPDWIAEAHAIWLRGDDVDVEQGVANHRLPIFSGVVLSLSGIDDVQRRTDINRFVTAHQGVYLKNLERPVRVTHLLCSGDKETDKMKYAEKFNKRKEAHIHVVWEEWFWDCLEFGGRFDERKYQVSRPRPERKSLHEIPLSLLPVKNSGPSSQPESAISVDNAGQSKRPKSVVPTGSFTVINNLAVDGEEEEMANINRPVRTVTLQLWQTLLKPRGFELEGGKLVRSPSKSQATRSSPSTPTRSHVRRATAARNGADVEHGKEKESVISSFRRAQSFASVPPKEPAIRQPFRRSTTCLLVCPGEAGGSGSHETTQPNESAVPILFAGYTFRLLGEARCANVRAAIENGGGTVTDDDVVEPSFIVVRLISGSKLYRDEFDDYARTKYRTECWLEHSVFHERICEPDENVSFTPLKITTPVPDAEKINLSLSGLDQSELCWIRRLVRAVGIALEPTFSPRSTHLLCPSGTGAKYDKALEWRIPVISLAWLEDIARTGIIPRVDEYIVGGSRVAVADGENGGGFVHRLDSIPEVRRDKGKGKGKEKDSGYQMMDITNDGLIDQPMFGDAAFLQGASQHCESGARQHHKVTKPASPPHSGLFGKPRFLTHDSDPPEGERLNVQAIVPSSSSPAYPPPQSRSPSPIQVEPSLPAPTPPTAGSLAHLLVTPVRRPAGSIRNANADVNLPVQTQAQVPSSTSPSPMKLFPSSTTPDAFAMSSPPRPPDTDAITKALHESLTSLLGKRPIVEDEVIQDGDIACVGGAGAKKGKRMRPGGPSNVPSRVGSREDIVYSPHRPVRPPVFLPPLSPDVDVSLLDGLGMGARSTEESMRVTYEDPGQAEEKRRLLRMLGGDANDVVVQPVSVQDVEMEVEVVAIRKSGSGGTRDSNSSAGTGRARRIRRAKVPGF